MRFLPLLKGYLPCSSREIINVGGRVANEGNNLLQAYLQLATSLNSRQQRESNLILIMNSE